MESDHITAASQGLPQSTLDQGQTRRHQVTTAAEPRPVDPDQTTDGGSQAGSRWVQPGHRQQPGQLRRGRSARRGCGAEGMRDGSRNHPPEEGGPTQVVRVGGSNAPRGRCVPVADGAKSAQFLLAGRSRASRPPCAVMTIGDCQRAPNNGQRIDGYWNFGRNRHAAWPVAASCLS